MREVLKTDCTIRPLEAPAQESDDTYVVCLTNTDTDSRLQLVLNSAAARAIADVASTQLGGAIGFGPLSQTEFGVIDYVVASTLIEFAQEEPSNGWRVESFGPDQDQRPRQNPDKPGPSGSDDEQISSGCWPFSVSVGLLQGEATAHYNLPEFPQHPPASFENQQPSRTDALSIELRFGPRELDADDVDQLVPGDVLLLGTTTITGPGRPLRIVSESGWELARANAVSQTPLRTTVEVGPWEFAAPATSNGRRLIDVRLGLPKKIDARELELIAAGDTFDFENPEGARVGLLEGPTTLAEGELVQIDGEIGVRVLALPARPSGDRPCDHGRGEPTP